MAKHYWLACIFVAAAAAACGGDDGGGGVAIDDFPAESAAAQCAQQVECGDMPDLATCLDALVFEGNDVETLIAGVKDGTILYDEGQAGECLDFIESQGCEFEGFYGANPCGDLFQGTLNQGDACFDGAECAGTADCEFTDPNCDPSSACCAGTCGTGLTEQVAAGGPCNDGANFCDFETLFCEIPDAGGPGVCTDPNPTEGAPCTEIDGCDNPMYCNLDFATGMGNCTIPAGPGEGCALDELLPCADISQFCDSVALVCTDNVGPGTACDAAAANGAACVGFANCTNGSCVADGGDGDTCDATNGPDCLGTLSCEGTTCTAPAPGIACN